VAKGSPLQKRDFALLRKGKKGSKVQVAFGIEKLVKDLLISELLINRLIDFSYLPSQKSKG
jgi:hypothetical protein